MSVHWQILMIVEDDEDWDDKTCAKVTRALGQARDHPTESQGSQSVSCFHLGSIRAEPNCGALNAP